MRNTIYRLMFFLVAISVVIETIAWLMIGAGIPKGYCLIDSWYTFFANPIPTIITNYPPLYFLRGIPFRLTIVTIMLLLVVRRIIFFIKERKFATPPAFFLFASYILGLIGLASLAIVVIEVFLVMVPGWQFLFHMITISGLFLAQFLFPLAFLINEFWSLHVNKTISF